MLLRCNLANKPVNFRAHLSTRTHILHTRAACISETSVTRVVMMNAIFVGARAHNKVRGECPTSTPSSLKVQRGVAATVGDDLYLCLPFVYMSRKHMASRVVAVGRHAKQKCMIWSVHEPCSVIQSVQKPVFADFYWFAMLTTHSDAYILRAGNFFVLTTTTSDIQTNCFTPCACVWGNKLVRMGKA